MLRNLKTLGLEEARGIIDYALGEAVKDELAPVAIAVVGNDGRLIAFAAMDGVVPMTIQTAQDKAYTAVIGKFDTLMWERLKLDSCNFSDPRFCCFGGGAFVEIHPPGRYGNPLGRDGKMRSFVIGAIGVSGRSSIDNHKLADKVRKELYRGNIINYSDSE